MKNDTLPFYAGLLLFSLAVANVALWIFVATRVGLSFSDARQMYLSYFPGFLQNTLLLTGLNVVFCTISLYLLIRLGESLSRFHSFIRMPVVVVNTVLIAWNLFTLM